MIALYPSARASGYAWLSAAQEAGLWGWRGSKNSAESGFVTAPGDFTSLRRRPARGPTRRRRGPLTPGPFATSPPQHRTSLVRMCVSLYDALPVLVAARPGALAHAARPTDDAACVGWIFVPSSVERLMAIAPRR